MVLSFLRSDVVQLAAYQPHPGASGEAEALILDPLDTNECPYDLPADLKEKLAWAVQHTIAANRYPDGGHADLKASIAAYGAEAAPGLAAQHISVGNGSDELIRSLLIATCVGGEGSVLVANPTFSMYAILARTLGIPVVSVGRDDHTFAVDLDAAQQAIDQPAGLPVRMVFMVHPNSPTGNALTEAELAWLRQLPENILVVVDEAYFEFSQQTTVAEVLQRPNWVVLRTFSKAFRLAAFRVGYAVANPDLTAALEKVRLPYNLPSATQAAAALALAHRQELLAVIPEIQAQRDWLSTALVNQTPLQPWPSAANFIYARPTQPQRAMEDDLAHWFQQLKAQGTLIRHTGGGLRITVGSPAENQRTLLHITQGNP
ncbi:MAG: histidinol-phosphate transaminase [Leptolyngbya sp.]|nr:histidinol-phosphate transaminase [Leptolyngbya sp.]